MRSKILNPSEIEPLKVSSLPTRPTAPEALGGKGFTSAEMKAAFDKLPLYLFEKLSLLIEDLLEEGEDSIVGSFPTGLKSGQTLSDLLRDMRIGVFANYFSVNGTTLVALISDIKKRLGVIEERLGIS